MNADHDLPTSEPPAPGITTKFPSSPFMSASSYLGGYLDQSARAARSIKPVDLDRAAAILLGAYKNGAIVFSCGNGGSASIANHLQCDHVKGVRRETDLSPRVVSLNSNIELLTAIANDIAYEDVFAFQLQSQSRPGDVLVAISSSGRSPNIVRALAWARDHDLHTIALTGFNGGDARAVAEVAVHVDCNNYGIVEDLHQAVMHALAQYIRQSRMTADVISSTIF
jgi:D-sedoheptulose 7-phosphate isomerase/D-glycero-D-manno-heptose 1,7-bisphosphate phosphatase